MAIVNLQDLQVTFGAKTAVSAASFRVDAGETFSLIGASGCGKSTILRVLAGLQREWRGSVDLLGQAITPGARFQGDLRRNVQMVFQDPYASLHPNHTLWRTLAEPLQIHGIRDVAPRVTTALEQVGLAADAAEAVTLHYALEAFSFRDPGHVHPVLFREEFYGQRVAEIHFRHVLEFRKFAFRSRAGFLEVT